VASWLDEGARSASFGPVGPGRSSRIGVARSRVCVESVLHQGFGGGRSGTLSGSFWDALKRAETLWDALVAFFTAFGRVARSITKGLRLNLVRSGTLVAFPTSFGRAARPIA